MKMALYDPFKLKHISWSICIVPLNLISQQARASWGKKQTNVKPWVRPVKGK